MGARNRMSGTPEQRRASADGSARRTMSGIASLCEVVSAAVLCAMALTVPMINVEPQKPSVVASSGPPPVSQPVRQQGTVIAVSGNSVTARSANGYTQTYVVTPNTTVISKGGTRLVTAPAHFALNDQVDIVGTIQGGTALATAVAAGVAGQGDGPPMDFDAGPGRT
ncbi:MAG: hypothetical protein QOC58_805 [Mycobacterium sp.]|nr:hypothetical protein [Mycobacterium sp.]